MAAPILTRRQVRALGFFPLAFFSAQAIHYWEIHELGQMMWMCNIGNLLLALGLFLEQAVLIRVAVIWMVPGVAVWALYVVPTWGMILSGKFTAAGLFAVLSSSLAHVGGFSVGALALRQFGMDRRAWWYAFAWYFAVQLLSRVFTPAAMNVNVSQRVQTGWEQTFTSYLKFWLVLTVLVGICLWILETVLKRIWPAPPAFSEARREPLTDND